MKKLTRMATMLTVALMTMMMSNCNIDGGQTRSERPDPAATTAAADTTVLVERADTNGLTLLFPRFSRMDLVCGTMPSKTDSTVILVAEAAYTGQLLNEFSHRNIAGDHVSGGTRYAGYTPGRGRLSGAFAWWPGQWLFVRGGYSSLLDTAAAHGGAAFAQELLISSGTVCSTVRPDGSANVFRSLCDIGGRLCIAESQGEVTFGRFKQSLADAGATDAIYLDMGSGWNYAWYRPRPDTVVELHPYVHPYCTNWVTFYR